MTRQAEETGRGGVLRTLLSFALPYLLACFLQSFYGLADLFIVGQFNGASSLTGVSVGSQVLHMLTVVVCGLCMGVTVSIGRSLGSGDLRSVCRRIGNTCSLFAVLAVVLTVLLVLLVRPIVSLLHTPPEAVEETREYLLICFCGFPLIVGYNVISGIFRGVGDSLRPMLFVVCAGVLNILLDYILIGGLGLGPAGAGLATVISQGLSVVLGVLHLRHLPYGLCVQWSDCLFELASLRDILRVGLPVALQDGFIQIAFLVITMIANSRGLEIAASVGIVEKIISFLFLVPSAMLSSVSALVAQEAGGGRHARGRMILGYSLGVVLVFGGLMCLVCHFCSEGMVGLFVTDEPAVVRLGGDYLRGYIYDCGIAGVHFCFSGYFCAYRLAGISFFHNVVSIVTARIPGAYIASVCWPESLYPMGLAVPLGSLVSVMICVIAYAYHRRHGTFG